MTCEEQIHKHVINMSLISYMYKSYTHTRARAHRNVVQIVSMRVLCNSVNEQNEEINEEMNEARCYKE